jgi:hypothetical protein
LIEDVSSIALGIFEKKCDLCGKAIQGPPVNRYSRNFCSSEHVASYFGADVEEDWDEVYWVDFY